MKFFVIVVILTLSVAADACGSMHNPFYCYSTDSIRSMTNMASVITSYEVARRFNFTTVNPYTPIGTPSRIWYLGRYGARFPVSSTIQSMINLANSSIQADIVSNYEAGRTSLCKLDFEAIRDWTIETDFGNNFTVANAWQITESGVVATRNIARRLQTKFPNSLNNTYSRDRFYFRHTNDIRTNTSIRAFVSGLFSEAESQNVIYEDVPDYDWLLRPSDFCPAFKEEIANNHNSLNFARGPEIEEMIQEVSRRLGFHSSNQLSFQQIFQMWNWCVYTVAMSFELSNSETGETSAWCVPFSIAHHLLLEYYVELDFFYRFGYGVRNQRLLENLNCGMMQDLLTHMQSDDNTDQKARVFVVRFEEIQPMLVTLGAFRDIWPLNEQNCAQQSARRWRTSLITPLSTNIVVVRFDNHDDGDHDLIFLLNEKPMLLPGCDQQTGVCKLSVIVNRFRRFIRTDCEVSFCSNN